MVSKFKLSKKAIAEEPLKVASKSDESEKTASAKSEKADNQEAKKPSEPKRDKEKTVNSKQEIKKTTADAKDITAEKPAVKSMPADIITDKKAYESKPAASTQIKKNESTAENKKKNSESAIKAISTDFKTEKAKTEAPAQKKAKAIGISHFDTAVNSENEFTEDANDKY